MSTTSFFYHTFGTVDYQHISTKYKEGKVFVHMKKKEGRSYCTQCKSHDVIFKDNMYREIPTLPIGKKQVILCLHLHKLECKGCGAKRLETVEVAKPRKQYTKKLAAWVLDLLKAATIKDVAKIVGLSWDQVKEIEKEQLKKKYEKPNIKDLKYISIDEFYLGKKQKYFTFVTDLISGRIVYVAQGKDGECLKPFFKKLKRSKVDIEAASIDMGRAYICAIKENLPETPIVFDHFHVVKLINTKLDELRRYVAQQAELLGIPAKKGLRWVLLKNPENLTCRQESLLEELLQVNTPLTQAYILKEQFRSFWSLSSREEAEQFLDQWITDVKSIDAPLMTTLANTIDTYRFGLLNYFEYSISSGLMEGLNNKIATMVKRAYGYRDIEYFELKVKAIHETKHTLVG